MTDRGITTTGALLACDVGTVRIGLARSDAARTLAVPMDAVAAGESAFDAVLAAIAEVQAVEVIVGLPLRMDGTEGPAAAKARTWVDTLATRTSIPIRLVDERLTTVEAQRGLHAAGRTTRTSRAVIDSASAVVLLQSCLDAKR